MARTSGSRPLRAGRLRSARDEVMVWLCGAASALSLVGVFGVLAILLVNGLPYFWPAQPQLITLDRPGSTPLLGVVQRGDPRNSDPAGEFLIHLGDGGQFTPASRWLASREVLSVEGPGDSWVFETLGGGRLYGTLDGLRRGRAVLAAEDSNPDILAGLVQQQLDLLAEIRSELEALRVAGGTGDEVEGLRGRLAGPVAQLRLADGRRLGVPLADVIRAYRPGSLSLLDRAAVAAERMLAFVARNPSQGNIGGVFPAIIGTVCLVFLMTVLVAPLGVVTAIYLHEYAPSGPVTRMVRIAVNNLAGVPSIVFGVFGLGFFVYGVGGSIDRLFYDDRLPAPTFGTPGLLWSAFTLALLTSPVVIVATEEGLARIPRAMREGSLALGATRAETLWHVVLPAATPAITTGLILAIARAAGEVAPLMLVGAAKLAPALPVDGDWPFLHLERKFMHLGFHIYDVGLQSPGTESAAALVYATALLLVLVVVAMNLLAVVIRSRLRDRYTLDTN